MINPRISADCSTTKPIAAFSCTPRVQEVLAKHMINPGISADWSTTKHCTIQEEHTKAEVIQLTPGLLGLGVLFNCHA